MCPIGLQVAKGKPPDTLKTFQTDWPTHRSSFSNLFFVFPPGLGVKSLLYQLESLFNNLLLAPSAKRGLKDIESYRKQNSSSESLDGAADTEKEDLFSSADSFLSHRLEDTDTDER